MKVEGRIPQGVFCDGKFVTKIESDGGIRVDNTANLPFWLKISEFSSSDVWEMLLATAHRTVRHNRQEVKESEWCGCCYCKSLFRPADVKRWVENDKTALCPLCEIDAVVPGKSGFLSLFGDELNSANILLSALYDRWFGAPKKEQLEKRPPKKPEYSAELDM